MAKFEGSIAFAEEGSRLGMQDEAGNKHDFEVLAVATSEERSYVLLQEATMADGEALVFLETEDCMELVTDMELVESIFDAYNQFVDAEQA